MDPNAERRFRVLASQLAAGLSQRADVAVPLAASPCSAEPDVGFDAKEMYAFLTRDNIELRAQIFEFLKVAMVVLSGSMH